MNRPLSPSQVLRQPVPPAPQPGVLVRAAGEVWLLLAALGLLAGLIWRAGGDAPPLPSVLDAAGLALWLSALWLAPAWRELLTQRYHYLLPALMRWALPRQSAAWLVALALLLSLAPAALLLGYDPRATVAEFYLFDDFNLYLPVWLWVLGSLLLIGPTVVVAATLALHAARGLLGRQWGTALWLAVTVAVHAPLIAGTALLRWPLTLGSYADWVAATIAHTRVDTTFLDRLLGTLLRFPLLALLLVAILAVLAMWPGGRRSGRLRAGWLAALAATLPVALRVALETWGWASEPSQLSPGDWQVTFNLGLSSLWLAWWVLLASRDDQTPARLDGVAWTWYAASAWLCLTLPQVVADQVDRPLLLWAGLAALPLATAGVLLLGRASALSGRQRGVLGTITSTALLAILVLPWPLAGGFKAPALHLHHWLALALTEPAAAGAARLALAALVLLCLLLWPWRRRQRRARAVVGPPDKG